jgi:hypothetical protein
MSDPRNRMESVARHSPELELLLLCARWPQRTNDLELIHEQLTRTADPKAFLELASHHRLVPLVAHNLNAAIGNDVPAPWGEAVERLNQWTAANTYRALRTLAEARRVVQEFEANGIHVRILKGLPLAHSVFGDLNLRSAGDIDLLVDESSILEADRILREFTYQGLFHLERLTPKRLSFYTTHWKDVAYTNRANGFEVDLHWRCFRNRAMPGAALCANGVSEAVAFGGFQVNTLPATLNLLYLCVHGTLDGWLYFKSLADVAAIVRAMTKAELDQVATQAAQFGVLPEVSATLFLVSRYLTMDHWSSQLLPETDPTVRHILHFADRALVSGGFLSNRDAISTASMMAFEMGLRPNLNYRAELLVRILFRARMWEAIPLPDFLFGLYPLFSPFEWLYFRLKQRFDKPSSTVTLSV